MFMSQRMTKNPITISEDASVFEARNIMNKNKIHRLPVVDKNQKLQGIVTEKDLLYASPSPATTLNVYEIQELLAQLKVKDVMTKPVITVEEDTSVEEVAKIMVDHDIGGLPVIKSSQIVGIITESDLFQIFLEMFAFRQRGVRMLLDVPEEKGVLALLTNAISAQGGNIIALGTFFEEDQKDGLMTIKVQGLTEEQLTVAVQPFVCKILDVRTT